MTMTVVRYRAKPDGADENERLIGEVFRELAEREPAGLTYMAFRLPDGEFLHLARTEGASVQLPDLPSFQAFLAAGRQGNWETSPQPVKAAVIGRYWSAAE